MESKSKSLLKLINQKKCWGGGQKQVRVIEYTQVVWGEGAHTNQRHTLWPIDHGSADNTTPVPRQRFLNRIPIISSHVLNINSEIFF